MSVNTDPALETASILDHIEQRVTEIYSAQKNEVEQSLVERINREKEEAQKRIDAVNQEFSQVRRFLEEHKAVMAELQTTEEHLRGEIRGHFERAVNYQKMMENAAALADGELEKIGGLNQELDKVRIRAAAEYAGLKEQLSGYAGIVAQIPAPSVRTDEEVDWTAEISKLRKVRDLLATLRPAEGFPGDGAAAADINAADAAVAEQEPGAPPAEAETQAAEGLAASLGLIGPEDDSVRDDTEFAEADPAWAQVPGGETGQPAAEASAEPAAAPVEEPAGPPSEDPAVLETLARYRKTEPVNNGIEIAFFASETGTFLDADTFMAAVDKIIEGANQLHASLSLTTSVKDLFLLKQEILNQQEVLRKLFFRVVRFCDKEGGRLPGSLDELIGSKGLKDVIERLTMANWSDPSDFKPFLNELKALRRAFEARSAASSRYLRSVLDEVEGREN